MKKFDLIFGTIKVCLDFVLVVLAMTFAYNLRLNWTEIFPVENYVTPLPYEQFYNLALASGGVLILVFFLTGQYDFEQNRRISRELKNLFINVFVWLGVTLGLLFFLREEFFSRLIVIYALVGILVFLGLERVILNYINNKLRGLGIGRARIVFVGANKMTDELIEIFEKNTGVEVLGMIRTEKMPKKSLQKKLLGQVKNIAEIVKKYRPTQIIQTANLSDEESLELREFCYTNHLRYRFIPSSFMLRQTNVETTWVGSVPVLEMKITPLDGWGRIAKRAFDLFFSGIALILLSPIFLIIAVAIKLDSEGPILFSRLPNGERVKRVGRYGEPVNFLKFRTMRHNSHNERYGELAKQSHREGPLLKIKNDPRVTNVGKFLRRFSLDELPQLWNVLMGELSLVGPRAHLPEEVAQYNVYQKKVLSIKPGITGMGQVSGRSDLAFDEEVRLDIWYIENWSFWLDLRIILRTIKVVLLGGGAD